VRELVGDAVYAEVVKHLKTFSREARASACENVRNVLEAFREEGKALLTEFNQVWCVT